MAFPLIAAGVGAQALGGFLAGRAQDKAAKAAGRAFAPTAEEIAFQRQAFAAEGRDIGRREAEIIQLSRAMEQAGLNLGDLLKGRESASLSPLRGEIDRQRNLLRQQLAQRLGPGFETSTAGSQALNEFERQAAAGLIGAQQQDIALQAGIAQGNRRGITSEGALGLMGRSLENRTAAADIAALGQSGAITRAQTIGSLGQTAMNFGTLSSIFGGGNENTDNMANIFKMQLADINTSPNAEFGSGLKTSPTGNPSLFRR
jgi:hypothetical protein